MLYSFTTPYIYLNNNLSHQDLRLWMISYFPSNHAWALEESENKNSRLTFYYMRKEDSM